MKESESFNTALNHWKQPCKITHKYTLLFMNHSTDTTSRKILVTTALPYANGAIHLGHLVEYIQADIWVRFQKLHGHECYFVCGDDTHGTPIMISAEKQGITPEVLLARVYEEHCRDLSGFYIDFDYYFSTHSPENRTLAELIYQRLKERGDIEVRTIAQAYDPIKNIFLPDRYVKGDCPFCGAHDQYGDNCEACGATYSPVDMKNPVSVLSGATPVMKESEHYFFLLANYTEMLKSWMRSGHLQEEVANKLMEWFAAGLQSWDISRDAPYFGFEIPDAPGKYFYVWLDAPIGYMASFKKLCELKPDLAFETFWGKNSNAELYHFIGKDIIYFHALFWPAILEAAGFRKPTAVFAHGFLTINGKKMSKSRGTFITAQQYLNYLQPEYLRYYVAAKLSHRIDDIDLNLDDFIQRINADLVGKVINIASRCAGFIHKFFSGRLSEQLDPSGTELYQVLVLTGEKIAQLYETREYHLAIREIMMLADRTNQYIDGAKPWVLAKQTESLPQVQMICTTGLNLFKLLMLYLKPVLPNIAAHSENFLQSPPLHWQNRFQPLLDHSIAEFIPLLHRVEPALVEAMLAESLDHV